MQLKTKPQVFVFPAQEVPPALMEILFSFNVCTDRGNIFIPVLPIALTLTF